MKRLGSPPIYSLITICQKKSINNIKNPTYKSAGKAKKTKIPPGNLFSAILALKFQAAGGA